LNESGSAVFGGTGSCSAAGTVHRNFGARWDHNRQRRRRGLLEYQLELALDSPIDPEFARWWKGLRNHWSADGTLTFINAAATASFGP
jgi:hypothetical protein